MGNYAKLSLRYCRPFQTLEKVSPVAYKLALPANVKMHNVLCLSLLKKYVVDPKHITHWNVVQVEVEGEFQLEPLWILDRK